MALQYTLQGLVSYRILAGSTVWSPSYYFDGHGEMYWWDAGYCVPHYLLQKRDTEYPSWWVLSVLIVVTSVGPSNLPKWLLPYSFAAIRTKQTDSRRHLTIKVINFRRSAGGPLEPRRQTCTYGSLSLSPRQEMWSPNTTGFTWRRCQTIEGLNKRGDTESIKIVRPPTTRWLPHHTTWSAGSREVFGSSVFWHRLAGSMYNWIL